MGTLMFFIFVTGLIISIVSVIYYSKDYCCDIKELVSILFATGFAIILVLVIMFQLCGRQFIQEFKETEATYQRARENCGNVENATIQIDIAKMNRKLAVAKYWNSNWFFDVFYYDGIENLEPIE